MTDIEKAKRLGHLFYIMKKEHTSSHEHHHNTIRIRDIMTLNSIYSMIEKQEDGLVKMSEVSAYFRITPAAVSQLVREYERHGWLNRVILDHDRRSVYLQVTEKGRKMLKQNEANAMQDVVDFIHYLGEEDSDALLRILEKAKDYGPIWKQNK